MCAGATVFNALEICGTRPTDRVSIINVGGLGHLAIQFAANMGCEAVVSNGTDSKKEEAMKLGAMEFDAMKGVKGQMISKNQADQSSSRYNQREARLCLVLLNTGSHSYGLPSFGLGRQLRILLHADALDSRSRAGKRCSGEGDA